MKVEGRPSSCCMAGPLTLKCGLRRWLRYARSSGSCAQGARAALRFASQAPAQVTALILDGPPSFSQQAVDDDVPMNRFREWSNHALVQLCTEATLMQNRVPTMVARYPGREPAAAAPALILSGAYDLPSRLESALELCAKLPAAEKVILPEAGHLINLDQPALYSKLCRAFLQRHTSSGQ
jgi:pimeloyl-ACP methyl ester carboxylesterase